MSFAGIRKGEGGVSLKKWAWSKVGRVLRRDDFYRYSFEVNIGLGIDFGKSSWIIEGKGH